MNTIHRLRDYLYKALVHQDTPYDDQELFDELMVQKSRLLRLLDVGPRSSEEQREIEGGKPTLNGKAVAVNSDFAKQAVFLAAQLDCSEKYVAGILHDIMSENPNIDAVSSLELAVATFHHRRRHLVDSFRFLLQAAEAGASTDAPPLYRRLAQFVDMEILAEGTGGVTLPQKILKEMEQLDVVIGKADVARKNAGSNTVPPSAVNAALGSDVLMARYDSLKYERRYLAMSLSSIARLGYLQPAELKSLVSWLTNNGNHPMTYYCLTAVFLALNPVDPSSPASAARQILATESTLVSFMTNQLQPSTTWKEPALKAALMLKWTLFLTDARHNDATLENKAGFKAEELETQIWNAVQGDAFKYLALSVAHIRGRRASAPVASVLEGTASDQPDYREVPPPDFKDTVLLSFEALVRSLITHASSELRKIKQRQEDLVLAGARNERNRPAQRFASGHVSEAPDATPRHDIATLYCFIGLLYNALPEERALQFWGSGPSSPQYRLTYQETVEATSGRLPSFLQWAIWSTPAQDLTMLSSLYDMITGLSNGQHCSELAYNFMARGGGEVLPGSMLSMSSSPGPPVSWTAIFGLLESWATSASNPRHQPQPLGQTSSFTGALQSFAAPPPTQQFTLGPKDVILAKSFLRVLATVVSKSVPVRTAVAGHAQFRAIPTLLSLIPLGIPLELKGSIFDTLSAFAEAGAGAAGIEICKAIWSLMERVEVINVRMGPGHGTSMATGKGIEVELEQIEVAHHLYPSTIPFLKLLASLIHTPKQLSAQARAMGTEPLNTIPETLGQPYRLPGVAPFTSFVIDNVFSNIAHREYARPSDRWEINDLCLNYVERSLASFAIDSLVSNPVAGEIKQETLLPLLIHPGYDMMKRLLTETPLQTCVLSYLVDGLEGFEKGFADEEPFFRNTILRVLRIVHRVLEIQDIFLDVFIPLLHELNCSSVVGQIYSRSHFTRFDQALSFGPQYIPSIAAYVAYQSHAEVALLSVKILTYLASSLSSSALVTLIERSVDSERVLGGYKQILRSESMDDVERAEEFAEHNTGAGAPVVDILSEHLDQAARLAVLDLLVQETESGRPFPNIAHFLLFGGKGSDQTIQDPHALGARPTSIHVLLQLLSAGVPRLKGKRREQQTHATPLFASLPSLAERCYRVVYQLCVHPRTSDFTSRYLRSREDFFARQLARITGHAPETLQDPSIQVVYGDGSRVTTTVASFTAFSRLRSYVFDLVALELHVLTARNHHKAVSELLEILFGTDVEFEEEHNFPTFHEVGQSPMRIIDFLQSLLFDWADSYSVEPQELHYLAQVNLQSCIRPDAVGCDVVDRGALVQLLTVARRMLQIQGVIATQAQDDQLGAEINYVLESCAVENHRRKVSHARGSSFESWRRMLDMSLTKCFDRLPHNRRENMLFDLLHVLPAAIQSSNIEESTAVLLSETVLSTITKLREDRRHQVILQSVAGDPESGSLPAERLHNLLRNILEGILNSNHVELVRGNLYAALINFIHLTRSTTQSATPIAESESNPFAISLAASTSLSASVSFRRQESLPSSSSGPVSSLEMGNLAVLKPHVERLITTVARDAIDGTEVWKTIAFMLLDAVVQLSSLEKPHMVLSALSRHGILANFVRSTKEADPRLLAILKPDPEDLNALYVYESKMSLFVRMAQTRPGAERLLEAHVISVLSQCEFIDARPEADQSFIDHNSFLPSAIQRYHQLFMPALQVVDAILTTLGGKHASAANQALDFIRNHGSTIAILLKTEADIVSLALLQEIHLIISLWTNLLPSVPRTELLATNSTFGSIHLGVLSLATRTLARGKPYPTVAPQTDADVKLANQLSFGRNGNQSKFEVEVSRQEKQLRKAIIAYIGSFSEFTEPEITLVLSPVAVMPRRDEHVSYVTSTVPTIGDALAALEDISSELASTFKQILDIGAELNKRDQISIESSQNMLRDLDPVLFRNLDIDQKRVLLCQELERINERARRDATVLLDSLEMLLLLVWRHLEFYASTHQAPATRTTTATAMRLLATSDPEAFRQEVHQRIAPAVSKLAALESDHDLFGTEWKDSRGYLRIMLRRLRESVGLHDDVALD